MLATFYAPWFWGLDWSEKGIKKGQPCVQKS